MTNITTFLAYSGYGNSAPGANQGAYISANVVTDSILGQTPFQAPGQVTSYSGVPAWCLGEFVDLAVAYNYSSAAAYSYESVAARRQSSLFVSSEAATLPAQAPQWYRLSQVAWLLNSGLAGGPASGAGLGAFPMAQQCTAQVTVDDVQVAIWTLSAYGGGVVGVGPGVGPVLTHPAAAAARAQWPARSRPPRRCRSAPSRTACAPAG